MTTSYDNKGYHEYYLREVVNKEPPVHRFVVEKLYRMHRKNVIHAEPRTDCHVIVPDFLKDVSWKKLGEMKRKKDIVKQNEEIFQRISKVEQEPSLLSKDIEDHIKRAADVRAQMKKLSEQGRLKNLLKIQKDNSIILERIEKARPSLTSKEFENWYKPHVMYKEHRLVF